MAWVVWFTGLPGCGKTTIARKTVELLQKKGVSANVLQLDEIRKVLTPNPKYTNEERDIVYASLAYMAKLLYEAGVNVMVDATANRRKYRDLARELIPKFAEIYVKAPLEVCISREKSRKAEFSPKGIYKKAALKKATVPGVNVTYEEPLRPEIQVDAHMLTPEQSADVVASRIIELLES